MWGALAAVAARLTQSGQTPTRVGSTPDALQDPGKEGADSHACVEHTEPAGGALMAKGRPPRVLWGAPRFRAASSSGSGETSTRVKSTLNHLQVQGTAGQFLLILLRSLLVGVAKVATRRNHYRCLTGSNASVV